MFKKPHKNQIGTVSLFSADQLPPDKPDLPQCLPTWLPAEPWEASEDGDKAARVLGMGAGTRQWGCHLGTTASPAGQATCSRIGGGPGSSFPSGYGLGQILEKALDSRPRFREVNTGKLKTGQRDLNLPLRERMADVSRGGHPRC